MNLAYRNARSLPTDKVWCSRCPGFLPLAAFSKSRQKEVQRLFDKGARLGDSSMTSILFCNQCSGEPQMELKCTGCDRTRPLADFSYTQRNALDTARCRRCVAEIENVRPGRLEPEEDSSDEECMTSMSRGDFSSVTSSMGGVSLHPSNGFEAVPSTTRSSRVPTNVTTTTAASTSPLSISTTASTARLPPPPPPPPPLRVGAGGFATVRACHREVPVPVLCEREVETFDGDEEEEEWEM